MATKYERFTAKKRAVEMGRTGYGSVKDKSVVEQKKMFKYEPPIWPHLCIPNGHLDDSVEAQALWYYYLCARQTFEAHEADFQLIGDVDTSDMPVTTNYLQLFTSIAMIYSVEPAAMAKCWDMIDSQCWLTGLPKLPTDDKYRHNKIPEIILSS